MVLISIATSREYHGRSTNETETATDLDGTGKCEVHENRNSHKTSKASIEQGINPENKHQKLFGHPCAKGLASHIMRTSIKSQSTRQRRHYW
jgi:hypothetical protein